MSLSVTEERESTVDGGENRFIVVKLFVCLFDRSSLADMEGKKLLFGVCG